MIENLKLLALPFLIAVLVVWLAIPAAHRLGLVDKPGGRKAHAKTTPLVGGIGIILGLIVGLLISGHQSELLNIAPGLLIGSVVMFVAGLIDDRHPLDFKIRLLLQGGAGFLMAWSGEARMTDIGEVIPGTVVALGAFAIPMTIIGTIGVINSVNMIDGVDGLAGGLSVVILTFLGILGYLAGDELAFKVALISAGCIVGFLMFNFPSRGRAHATVFLGNSGSVLVGFLIAWLFMRLAEEPNRAFAPVTALWLFSVPLMDTLTVITRRIWLGKSPFSADRSHVHHLLNDAGFRVGQTVGILMAVQALLGMAGLIGEFLGVPHLVMALLFVTVFASYLYAMARPWRAIPFLRLVHRRSGLIVKGTTEIFIGPLNPERPVEQAQELLKPFAGNYGFSVIMSNHRDLEHPSYFAVLNVKQTSRVRGILEKLKATVPPYAALHIRQYEPRLPRNEKRYTDKPAPEEKRRLDRRGEHKVIFASRPTERASRHSPEEAEGPLLKTFRHSR